MNKIDTIELHVGHTVEVEVVPLITQLIQDAKKVHRSGSSKVDVARWIYPKIENLPKQSIWYTFIHGIDMTSRGAVSYYYLMKKEFAKLQSVKDKA